MQAWFDTKEETIADYNERISDGIHVLYPQEKILHQNKYQIVYLYYNQNLNNINL